MKQEITCEDFMECLDGLATAALPGEELVKLEGHAETCPDCAMLLRVRVHLGDESPRDLEARVPEEMVTGMWPRVSAEIAARKEGAWRTPDTRQHATDRVAGGGRKRILSLPMFRSHTTRSWLAPAMAAGLMILLFATGFLLGEVRHLRQRERILTSRVLRQERLLVDVHRAAVAIGAGQPASTLGKPAWKRILTRQEKITIADVSRLLDHLPAHLVILSAEDLAALLWQRPQWRGVNRIFQREGIQTEDGLQTGEIIRIMDTLELNPEWTIDPARLLALATTVPPRETSQTGRRMRLLEEE